VERSFGLAHSRLALPTQLARVADYRDTDKTPLFQKLPQTLDLVVRLVAGVPGPGSKTPAHTKRTPSAQRGAKVPEVSGFGGATPGHRRASTRSFPSHRAYIGERRPSMRPSAQELRRLMKKNGLTMGDVEWSSDSEGEAAS